ncbi:hypothetical protein ACFPL7_11505 [Dongia soli]|uniref:Uncharacterized protein n=1 Tax=Dongia soli TaxID=600628 RepID=A0ABU5EC43_9PROT|nr:hypothetical protein [Dongia soli]MDY0883575.1 hypothetical protein [Dongia soli]
MANPVVGNSTTLNIPAVRGDGANVGIVGTAQDGWAISGESKKQVGVRGVCDDGWGVSGDSKNQVGVRGYCEPGWGVAGESKAGVGVRGFCESGAGIFGTTQTGIGVYGEGGRLAGYFKGDVEVTGDIRLINADCAEEFDVREELDPGTVVVLAEEGTLLQSKQAYDKRVAGVVCGAGNYRPGIILDKQEGATNRLPIGLLGKVYCKADATLSAIETGDLLTTSPTPGHAMKATDPLKAFGAVIGKALRPLKDGLGVIPILISLR